MVLDFLNDTYAFIMVLIGVIGLLMGINRILKKEEEESKIWQWLGGISGIALLVVVIVVSINRFDESSTSEAFITNYTILFGIVTGMSLIARPFKKVPIAFAFSVIAALALLYVVMVTREAESSVLGVIPLQFILLGAAIIVLLIFIISFVQEQALDIFLWVLSWGSLVVILSLIIIAQGITLLIDFPNEGGILSYLPG